MSSSGTISIDAGFVKSINGILYILEAAFSLITFICAMIWLDGGGAQWVQFVSILGFIFAVILLLFHLFGVWSKLPASVPWLLIELIISATWALFFVIAGIVAAVYAGRLGGVLYLTFVSELRNRVIATTVFCFVCIVIWILQTIFLFKKWREGGNTITMTTTTTTTTTKTEPSAIA